MISTALEILFAGISAVCAVWGVVNVLRTQRTADNISSFYEKLKSKNDLLFYLERQVILIIYFYK